MSHSLVLGLFPSARIVASATEALHADGFGRESLSVVARSHTEEAAIAKELGATPGVEIEDSRPAARLGELGGLVIAAAAVAMPGVAPLVAAGPLSAELGEAVGHLAGGLAAVLTRAGVGAERAESWQRAVAGGQVLLGVHVDDAHAERVAAMLGAQGAGEVELARWKGALPS